MTAAPWVVSVETVRWIVAQARHNVRSAFDYAPPHYCHVCGEPVEQKAHVAHVKTHERELERLRRAGDRERDERLREVARLRRETS